MGDSVIRIGRVLSDNYRIERVIGRGGMATVFEASHLRLPIRVALKVITAPLDDAQEFLIRFRREAETLARLEHPHVVSVYDWNVTDDGLPYLVMELLCGEDLTQRLRKTPRLPKRLALHIFSQIAQALQAAHRHSIVHRDIKPSNLPTVETWRPKFRASTQNIAESFCCLPVQMTCKESRGKAG